MSLPFDISNLNSVLGAYFRENSGDIFLDAIYKPEDSDKTTVWDLMEKVVIKDERAYATADFDPEAQDADNAYSAQGNAIVVNGRILKMRYLRSDFKIEVLKLWKSWLGHVEQESYHNQIEMGDLKAVQVAFGRWIVEGMVEKIIEKFRLQTSFQGVHVPGFDDTASFPSAANGYLKVIADAITALDIPASQVIAAGGPITSANAFTHMEAIGEAISEKFYYKNMVMMAAVKNSRNYDKAFKAANPGANPQIYGGYKRTQLESADNVSIIPVPEMQTSDRIFATSPMNFLWGTNFDSMPPEIYTSVAEDPLVINVTIRYGGAFGFKRIDHIWTNDQA